MRISDWSSDVCSSDLDGAGGPLTLRIDGAGHVLRRHAPGDGVSNGGLFVLAYDLHETVLAGNAGAWFVDISGLLLLSNIILGIKLAWPGKGHLGRALRPPSARPALARLYGWHRMAGLWLAVPDFITPGSTEARRGRTAGGSTFRIRCQPA